MRITGPKITTTSPMHFAHPTLISLTPRKYGIRDHRGGGRSSARGDRVPCGRRRYSTSITSGQQDWSAVRTSSVFKTLVVPFEPAFFPPGEVDAHPTRCPHPSTAAAMEERIAMARQSGDTVGGSIVLVCPRHATSTRKSGIQ